MSSKVAGRAQELEDSSHPRMEHHHPNQLSDIYFIRATYLTPQTNLSLIWRDGPSHSTALSCLWRIIDLYLGMRKPN